MKFKRMLAVLLCLAMLTALAGCTEKPVETQPTTVPTTVPEPTVEELYAQAAADLLDEEYIKLDTEVTRTTTVGVDTFTKTMEQNFTWKKLGTEEMEAKVVESITIGEEIQRFTEVFREGEVYQTLDSLAFVSQETAESFEARWIDPVPLELERYASVTKEENADGILIRFEEAEELEDWVAPEYAILEQASGTAQLDAEGKLTRFTYTAVYRQGAAKVELDTQVTVLGPGALDLTLRYPADDERYVLISDPRIPRIIADSYSNLILANAYTATITQSMSSEALSAGAAMSMEIASWGSGEEHMSEVNQAVAVQIYRNNRVARKFNINVEESYRDGVYSYSKDKKKPETSEEITGEQMRDYGLNMMVERFPGLNYITGATLTDFGGICIVELDCDVALAQAMSRNLTEYLTSDASYLDRLASSYKTTTMDYYVAINTDTGLPTSSGVNYAGIHTIDGENYNMSYQAYQSVLASSGETYEILTQEDEKEEERPVEEEPEEKATPLFYKVTGQDGQQMWLMGTIHVGDERTAYLPQEIYDALDSSSALAVEFDMEAFYKQLEKDEKLATRVAYAYVYTDGSTIVDHVDPVVYAASSKLMKASGYNVAEMNIMKPYFWGNMIEEFYTEQGYSALDSDKGVDNRLMERAREKKIKILDVESGIEQLEMLGSFSDGVQEMLLTSAMATPCAVRNNSTQELYEMWCKGDEAALIEYLKDDTSDMTKQEKALYDEYNREMSTKRNAKMLEVAKGYLESGDVVFYAVGLAHLLAEDGLVNTLREAGYTVELVTYAG